MIDLAQLCESLNNFNGVMELLAGIDNSAVYRLRHSWAVRVFIRFASRRSTLS